jgi:hypothetical protein
MLNYPMRSLIIKTVKKHLILLWLLLCGLIGICYAATYYVSTTGSNTNDGSATSPWRTITYALTRVSTGDTLSVSLGTYGAASGESFPLSVTKSITLLGTNATIESNTTDEVIELQVPGGTATLDGFSLIALDGAAIRSILTLGAGNLNILNNNIISSQTADVPNGIDAGGSSYKEINLRHNVIVNCRWGVGINNARANIFNNTTYHCLDAGLGFRDNVTAEVENNIVCGTSGNSGVGIQLAPGASGSTVTCRYNNLYQNNRNYSDGITTDETAAEWDPLFVSTTEGVFRLMSSSEGFSSHSPCIDAGDPAFDYHLEPEPNGQRINMGAYGGTPYAEKSVPTTTTTTTTSTTTTRVVVPYGTVISSPTLWRPDTGPPIKIAYTLSADAATRVIISSSGGEILLSANFVAGSKGGQQGYNEISWDGNLSGGNVIGNGVYVVQIISGTERLAKGYITVLQ